MFFKRVKMYAVWKFHSRLKRMVVCWCELTTCQLVYGMNALRINSNNNNNKRLIKGEKSFCLYNCAPVVVWFKNTACRLLQPYCWPVKRLSFMHKRCRYVVVFFWAWERRPFIIEIRNALRFSFSFLFFFFFFFFSKTVNLQNTWHALGSSSLSRRK